MIIDNQNLSMIRGDSEVITVTIYDNVAGERTKISLVSGSDTVYLTVKLNTTTAEKILQKVVTVFTEGEAVIELNPTDTKNLAARAYKYDIQWVSGAGKVKTILGPALFTLQPEVTFEVE
jgi:hypothetical protein